jgi:hypothetical protein
VHLVIGEEFTEFDNNEASIEQIIKTIEEKAAFAEQIFSHLVIDEVEVFDDYVEYMYENLATIKVIQAQFMTLREFMQGILLSTSEYLDRAIPAVEQLAAAVYSSVDADAWQQIDQLIEGVQWLQQSFDTMDTLPNLANRLSDYEQWNLYSQALRELLDAVASLGEPLQFGDHVSVSDILLYEIKPILERLRTNLPSLA